MRQILVIGSANVDLVMATDRLPQAGETIFGEFSRTLGGKGANQAVAAARAGGDVAMVACLGNDEYGASLRAGLASEGINTDGIVNVGAPSGVAAIVTAASGTNVIVVARGANAKLEKSLIRPSLFHTAQYLLLQLEIPFSTVVEAVNHARSAGVKIILDPAPAELLPRSLLEQVDWLTPNETEARILLGIGGDALDAVEMAYALRELGANNVVLKLGDRGAVLLEAGGDPVVLPAVKVSAVDTTAAGDAFNGAFAAALAREDNPTKAARFATIAAGFAVSRPGAQAAMATYDEVVSCPEWHVPSGM